MWVKPRAVDVKMDAEIGSYQEDDPGRDPRFVTEKRAVDSTELSRKSSRTTVDE